MARAGKDAHKPPSSQLMGTGSQRASQQILLWLMQFLTFIYHLTPPSATVLMPDLPSMLHAFSTQDLGILLAHIKTLRFLSPPEIRDHIPLFVPLNLPVPVTMTVGDKYPISR